MGENDVRRRGASGPSSRMQDQDWGEEGAAGKEARYHATAQPWYATQTRYATLHSTHHACACSATHAVDRPASGERLQSRGRPRGGPHPSIHRSYQPLGGSAVRPTLPCLAVCLVCLRLDTRHGRPWAHAPDTPSGTNDAPVPLPPVATWQPITPAASASFLAGTCCPGTDAAPRGVFLRGGGSGRLGSPVLLGKECLPWSAPSALCRCCVSCSPSCI